MAALVLGFVTAFCFAPRGGMQPIFASLFPESLWILPSLGFLTGLAAVILLIAAATQRRPIFKPFIVMAVCFSVSYYLMNGKGAEAAWRRVFAEHRSELDRAVGWASQVPSTAGADRDQLLLPGDLKELGAREQVVRFRNDEGKVWYLFPQVIHGIDDGAGYAWSKSGMPPPRNSLGVFKAKPLGDGWFLFWMT